MTVAKQLKLSLQFMIDCAIVLMSECQTDPFIYLYVQVFQLKAKLSIYGQSKKMFEKILDFIETVAE